ncbi:MAG: DUF2236 domain-containing protein [Deltaproteobacteria bacterium]|nr:DUF2236 domain-containing protein [Deltaproteobacteria bacterium]
MEWTDDRLDEMMATGDPWADKIFEDQDPAVVGPLINKLYRRDFSGVPPVLIKRMEEFRAAYRLDLLDKWTPADHRRMRQAERAYLSHSIPAAACLLLSAVPQGYCAPRLSRVLTYTGLLEEATLRRLLGVLQMVLDVIFVGGFEEDGQAVRTGVHLRFMHAAIRRLLKDQVEKGRLQWDEAKDGALISREDMLGTLMGFSLLVTDGLPRLGFDLDKRIDEDIWFLWRNFGRTLGIPDRFLPTSDSDARVFYEAYMRRHFKPASENPDGVKLAAANLKATAGLLKQYLPFPLNRGNLPYKLSQTVMVHLIGPDLSRKLDVDKPPMLLNLSINTMQHVIGLVYDAVTQGTDRRSGFRRFVRRRARSMNQRLFENLIQTDLGGRPMWEIPSSLADLQKLVDREDMEPITADEPPPPQS